MNKKRKAKKAFKLWEYYFYKKQNDIKAIYNFKRAIASSSLYKEQSAPCLVIAKSYYYLWNNDEALWYINQALEISPFNIDNLQQKIKILTDMWRQDDAKKYQKIIDEQDKKADQVDMEAYLNLK